MVENIDLSGDSKDFEDASDNEKHFLKTGPSVLRVAPPDRHEEHRSQLQERECDSADQVAFQEATEAVHRELYSLLIRTYFKDMDEQHQVMRFVQTMPIIEKKTLWVEKWMNPETASLAERLVGFTCLGGVSLGGSFCAIYWLKKQQRFKGLSFANYLITRDEDLHATASVLIYKHLEKKLP